MDENANAILLQNIQSHDQDQDYLKFPLLEVATLMRTQAPMGKMPLVEGATSNVHARQMPLRRLSASLSIARLHNSPRGNKLYAKGDAVVASQGNQLSSIGP